MSFCIQIFLVDLVHWSSAHAHGCSAPQNICLSLIIFSINYNLFVENCTYMLSFQFYKDPVSGYIFRSKKDALRYIETGEISRSAIRPKELCNNAPELVKDEIAVSFSPLLVCEWQAIFIVDIVFMQRFSRCYDS